MTTSSRIALGAGALFLGGVVGGLVGTWAVGRGVSSVAAARAMDDDRALELARVVRELAAEVAALRRTQPLAGGVQALERPSERAPAKTDAAAEAPHDLDRIVAALEGLTAALDAASARGIGTGAVDVPVRLGPPSSGTNGAVIEQLVARDSEALTREFMLWNRQQVLDLLGPPNEIADGAWLYHWRASASAQRQMLIFLFDDGFVKVVQTR